LPDCSEHGKDISDNPWSKDLLERPIVAQIVKESLEFYTRVYPKVSGLSR
jgi:hypothetical protein